MKADQVKADGAKAVRVKAGRVKADPVKAQHAKGDMTDPLNVVDEVEQITQLRDAARVKLGVTGDTTTRSLREVSAEFHVGYYPLFALGLLSIADTFQSFGFTVLTPEISSAIGISIGAIAAARALQTFAIGIAPLPIAALSQSRGRRAMLCIVTGLLWSLITLYTGFTTSFLALLVVLFLDGLSTGSVTALHYPLVLDSYPTEIRVRALSAYSAFGYAAQVVSPALVALFAGALGFTWRGVFLGLGLTSTLMTLCALGLKDPGFGKWDTEQVRATVQEAHGEAVSSTELDDSDVELGFWEICRRVLLIPTAQRMMTGGLVFGILTIPAQTFISVFLDQRWNLGPGGRGLFFAYIGGVSVLGLILYGRRGEKQFRASPARVVRTVGVALAVGVIFVALGGLSPWFVGMLFCFGVFAALVGILGPALGIALLSVIPSRMRPHAQALFGIFIAVGGVLGAVLFAGIDSRYGIGGTMVAIAIPGVIGALVIGNAGRFIDADLDRMIDDVLEESEIQHIRRTGGHLPMLTCRKIDFSYGQLQVLFDVDFSVDDGEMVALLGVNGAGKSTLLKVISGIGLPSGGSVRYRGKEITYLDAERRVRLGITQIPGGRAVFGPMTVVENLRSFGHTVARDRQLLDRMVDDCLATFPRLDERRNSLASTLSGGEQQMLGLSRALILQPQLLLIDELSLGLAPVIVSQLLDMVRRINAGGTAVVLVEQSVNIALNLVDHAYFMEKGEMRFDGRSRDLLERDDLLRAVFLGRGQ